MTFRRTSTPIRVDFTPFVDLAFLLLTFFMLIKTVQKPAIMSTSIRNTKKIFCAEHPKPDAHVFLLANNRIGFLRYRPDGSNAEFLETDYSVEGIRKQLLSISLNHKYGAIVLIKPTNQATFKNIVDVLDELQILGHIGFHLGYDLTVDEKAMLGKYKRYKAANLSTPVLIQIPLYAKRIPII